MIYRIAIGALGFVAGVFTLPFVVCVWPFFCAYFMFNEVDKEK